MKMVEKLKQLFRSEAPNPEDIAEAQRIRDDLETQRLSQRSAAGENYQAFGGPGT
jgi:hypothetical protein